MKKIISLIAVLTLLTGCNVNSSSKSNEQKPTPEKPTTQTPTTNKPTTNTGEPVSLTLDEYFVKCTLENTNVTNPTLKELYKRAFDFINTSSSLDLTQVESAINELDPMDIKNPNNEDTSPQSIIEVHYKNDEFVAQFDRTIQKIVYFQRPEFIEVDGFSFKLLLNYQNNFDTNLLELKYIQIYDQTTPIDVLIYDDSNVITDIKQQGDYIYYTRNTNPTRPEAALKNTIYDTKNYVLTTFDGEASRVIKYDLNEQKEITKMHDFYTNNVESTPEFIQNYIPKMEMIISNENIVKNLETLRKDVQGFYGYGIATYVYADESTYRPLINQFGYYTESEGFGKHIDQVKVIGDYTYSFYSVNW